MKPIVVSIGEILWDVLPTGRVLGGAPANVAWHASQLGADSRIVSAVGTDSLGEEILRSLEGRGLDGGCVAQLPDRPTSTVEAMVDANGVATYVIHPGVAWDFLPVVEEAVSAVRRAKAVNFGSLAQRGEAGRRAVQTLVDHAPAGCLRVFDINLRPGSVSREVLHAGFARSDLVKVNSEELLFLADLFDWPGKAMSVLDSLLACYPCIAHVVVTRGGEGAWWKTREAFLEGMAPSVKVADTIGAGDSFTAAAMMGLLAGMPPAEIMEAALEISAFVCGCIGATPVLPDRLKALIGGSRMAV